MNIYFAGSMAGGQQYKPGMDLIVEELRHQGHHIMTGFVVGEEYEDGYPTNNAWERDIPLLQECDAVVAEVSQLSTGVGIELGVASVAFGKQILCLRDKTLEPTRLSQLITKGPFITSHYDPKNREDLRSLLKYFCAHVGNEIEKQQTRRETEL